MVLDYRQLTIKNIEQEGFKRVGPSTWKKGTSIIYKCGYCNILVKKSFITIPRLIDDKCYMCGASNRVRVVSDVVKILRR